MASKADKNGMTMTSVSNSNQYKYANKNIIHQYMLQRFLNAVHMEIIRLSPGSILDFGCGEGLFLKAMLERGLPKDCQVTGIDIRDDSIAMARDLCPLFVFECTDLFKLTPEKENYDLVMAIEILEHLEKPGLYLHHLKRLCRKNLLLTVPNEPWFRLMNFLRGRNIAHLGDHPEHVNHWSIADFGSWVRSYLVIDKVYSVFPWVILVANK